MKKSSVLVILAAAVFVGPALAQSSLERASASVASTLSAVPQWYLQPTPSNMDSIFTSGTAISTNMSMSRSKALLDAQAMLGDQVGAMVSSMTKSYTKDVGVDMSMSIEDTERVVVNLAAEANIAGYHIREIMIMPEGRYFRTYVMLEYPIGQTNTVRTLQQQDAAVRAIATRKEEAYQELDSRVSNLLERAQ